MNVAKESVILTDELAAYNGLEEDFEAHATVCHSAKEYAWKTEDGFSVHTNTAESFFRVAETWPLWNIPSVVEEASAPLLR